MPIFSIPSKYGIGCFSKESYEFVDKLKLSGQKKWQILPLGPTGYGDSPYQSFSTFAGNPYFIDPETLINDGLLTKSECKKYSCDNGNDRIDYEKLYFNRFKLLKLAHKRFVPSKEYISFVKENESWLEDYSLFMAIKDGKEGKSWTEWEEDLKNRELSALNKAKEKYKAEIDFYKFQQYEFKKQWDKLHKYANDNGIEIIGDIPIYVALDSSDAWANPKLFQFDENNLPTRVAGCPPDAFSKTGQLWGNPLFDWDYHKKTGYSWWISRIRNCLNLYDIVRIDHFRGFDEYYAIPYGDKTAENGNWVKGPGIELFNAIKNELGDLNIIAEDLGFLTDTVLKLLKDSGFPGMKVLQFAFDSREPSNYLPHTYTNNCVVYTGTHDNTTTRAWYSEIGKENRDYAKKYLHKFELDEDNLSWDFIALAMASVAKLCIIPIQDYLCLGAQGRINQPSTLGGNWTWRMTTDAFDNSLASKIKDITTLYGRD